MLEAEDPREPVKKEVRGKQVNVIREMVKVNHHRNCMMCHAPANSGPTNSNALTAEVAVPGSPLARTSDGYARSTTELLIRLDVTYLRQDFSVKLSVGEAEPWPEMQRFDFFVRERHLSDEEAKRYREKLSPKEDGEVTPYQKAALAALREMTGKEAAPNAAAWKKIVNKLDK
jgi:hypothetical protein